jgi:phosphomannomutase
LRFASLIVGLETFIASRGGTQVRFKKGYLNVINEAKRRCKLGELVPLAVETSGHGAFAENNFSDDGTFTALLAASVVGEGQQAACLKGFEDAGYEEELRMEVRLGEEQSEEL